VKVELWNVARVKPYPGNPRKNKAAIAKLVTSLREFGWQQPIVVDTDGVILAGHTRYAAALELQQEKVPVYVASELSPAQAKAYRLMDNRSAEEASWDTELLGIELSDLQGMEFDLELTGFDEVEIRNIFAADPNEAAEEIPSLQEVVVSEPGDLWTLGEHRLICGDSTDKETVERLLAGAKPHLMVTDPPYGVEYNADWRNEALRKDGTAIGGRAIGQVLNDDNADWRKAWALFPGDVAYVWHAGLFAPTVAESLQACGFAMRSQIIWAKSNFAIGRGDYHWEHEPCWYAVREGRKGHWAGDRKQTTVWEIDKPQRSETGHSTQKPVECMKRPIENNSKKGDAVYEPFAGSGTTLVAAELTGRRCFAIELNPAYVDIIIRRFEGLTGIDAVSADGLSFKALAETRGKS